MKRFFRVWWNEFKWDFRNWKAVWKRKLKNCWIILNAEVIITTHTTTAIGREDYHLDVIKVRPRKAS